MIKLIPPLELDPELKSASLTVFICNGSYHLTHITIYQNGYVDCWGLVTFEEFVKKVKKGWVTVEIDPENDLEISIFGVGELSPGFEYFAYKSNEDLISEVKDIICELNNEPDSSAKCLSAWHQFNSEPSEENRLALKEAYEAIPKHNRIYVLKDQDKKDYPIRRAIYPESEYSLQEILFTSEKSEQISNQTAKSLKTHDEHELENTFMKNFQENLAALSSIKSKYENEIQAYMNQKLKEFHSEVNLPIQFIDIEIDNEEEDEHHLTQVSGLKLHINIEL